MKRSNRYSMQVSSQTVHCGHRTETIVHDREPFHTEPHSFGFQPEIDLDKLNQLVDELDADSFRDRLECSTRA